MKVSRTSVENLQQKILSSQKHCAVSFFCGRVLRPLTTDRYFFGVLKIVQKNTEIPYVYAAFPIFLTVANATFLLRKRKKSDCNLLNSPLILAGWERNVRFRMFLRNKMLRNTVITSFWF